jgi:epoxide hydrolase-like predicted phosphatase
MIKAVIFDYGGVLKVPHRLSDDLPTIFNISEDEVKKQRESTAPLFSLFQRDLIKENEFWKRYAEIVKKPVPKNCRELARELYQKSLILYPEVRKFVKKLRDKKIETAVLSNIIKLQADIIRKNNGYEGFDVVVLSYKEKLEKPAPEIYLLTAERLGVKSDECIFIDDKEKNILIAKSLGMKIVLANNPDQVIKDVSHIINLENEKKI